jgi:hypothetical protein
MDAAEDCRFMLVKLLQASNAQSPIDITWDGIVIAAKLMQSSNAYLPIDVTEDGMVMLVNPSHPWKA